MRTLGPLATLLCATAASADSGAPAGARTASTAEAPCVAVASEGADGAELTRLLSARDVRVVAPDAACDLRAEVARDGERLTLVLAAGARQMKRSWVDPRAAAAWVQSWVRADLAEPLIARGPRSLPRRAVAPSGAAPVTVAEGEAPRALGASAHGLLAWSSDGERWAGAVARVRPSIGGVRPTVGARVLFGDGAASSAVGSASRRWAAELLAGVDLDLAWGPIHVRPGAAVGVGLLRAERAACPDDTCAQIEDGFAPVSVGPRLEAHAAVELRVAGGFALSLEGAARLAPLAHTAPLVPAYAADLDEEKRARLALAGEPLAAADLAVGLRWEAP